MNQNNQQPGSADLPPLPRPESYNDDGYIVVSYTDEQMRQYARDAIAASRRAASGEPVAWRYRPFSPFKRDEDGNCVQSDQWQLAHTERQIDSLSAGCGDARAHRILWAG